ncbi:hypothetical protein RZN22_07470 [Bacillaceae bacterium S4-13-58]
MPNNDRNVGDEATPHFDGEQESIINDPTATQGEQMGIRVDSRRPFTYKRSIQSNNLQPDEDMREFKKAMEKRQKD